MAGFAGIAGVLYDRKAGFFGEREKSIIIGTLQRSGLGMEDVGSITCWTVVDKKPNGRWSPQRL